MTGTVVAALEDLFFLVQVKDAATQSGFGLELAKTPGAVVDAVRERKPVLVVMDLNFQAITPLDTIRALKALPETRDTPILAYVPHVQTDLRQAARDAGADLVAAKSAFSGQLRQMLAALSRLR